VTKHPTRHGIQPLQDFGVARLRRSDDRRVEGTIATVSAALSFITATMSPTATSSWSSCQQSKSVTIDRLA